MYEVEAGNDYQVEDELEGFEVSAEDVLVLQDKDFDSTSVEEVSLVLEQALNDLAGLAKHHHQVLSVPRASLPQAEQTLKYAVQFRAGLEKRYGSPTHRRFAVEAFSHGSNIVLALEEESTEQKGFFARMIEAIAKAFKWLWEKIKSLFSAGKKKVNEDKHKKDIEKLKEAESKNLKPKEEFITKDNVLGYYGFMGEHVTPAMVGDHLRLQFDHIKKMMDIIIDAVGYFENLTKVTANEASSEAVLQELIKLADSAMKGSFTAIPGSTKEVLQKEGAIQANQAISDNSARKLDKFLEGGAFYAWAESRNGNTIHSAAFIIPKEKALAKKLDYASSNELDKLFNECVQLDEAIEKLSETVVKKVEASTNYTDQLKRNLAEITSKASEEDKKSVQKLMTAINAVGSIVHKNTIAASRGFNQIKKASIAFFEYDVLSISREFEGDKPEKKAEDKSEDKK